MTAPVLDIKDLSVSYHSDRGLLPARLAAAVDRHRFHERSPSWWNPVAAAIALARLVDRFNIDDERTDRTTVNLAVKARKPQSGVHAGTGVGAGNSVLGVDQGKRR